MANTFELITSTTVGAGGVASVTISSIPSTYTDLCLKMSVANDTASWVDWQIRFNSTSTSSYTNKIIYMNGSSIGNSSDSAIQPRTPLSTQSWDNEELYVPNYAGSTNKSTSRDQGWSRNATGAGSAFTGFEAGLWSNTAAINSIYIVPTSGNIVQYSSFYLYGVKNA